MPNLPSFNESGSRAEQSGNRSTAGRAPVGRRPCKGATPGAPARPDQLLATSSILPDCSQRIQALLARCDQLRRGTTIDRPTKFNADGERHANRIAHQDRNHQ